MRFIKANWLYGKASSKMKKKQYDKAIDILTAILKLEDNDGVDSAIPMFDLGYCYYKIDNQDEALYWFSKCYGIYSKNSEKLHSEPFYQLLVHYSCLLSKKGDIDKANTISAEAEEFAKRLKHASS